MSQQELSVAVPEKDHLTLVSTFPFVVQGEVIGEVAIYDDTTTERHTAYRELYDNTGDLLVFSWFDSLRENMISSEKLR